ncbi:hypothetical protein N0V88_001215 [Collariella sp. IMI 366227]|nr:hypothetical protein N0V88_001215 [Collariella sp. IMI 366227]
MESLANLATTVGDRFTTNIKGTFTNLTPEKFIRIAIVAGAYLLLRPYIIKLGGKAQMKAYEEEHERAEEEAKAKMSANELRGHVDIPDDTDDEEEAATAEASGPDWGKKARRRQREMIKKLLDAEEERLRETQEELEDKDIEEYLIKD